MVGVVGERHIGMIDANPQPVSEFGTQLMELRSNCRSRYDWGEFTLRRRKKETLNVR
jgi:hypothetical protein